LDASSHSIAYRFVCHASLWDVDGISERMAVMEGPDKKRKSKDMAIESGLLGPNALTCEKYHDVTGEEVLYFVFSALCVRVAGEYRLKLTLVDVGR
jgi:Velvet factor